MRRVRRAPHLFFRLADDLLPDIARLLRGEVELVRHSRFLAVSILTGREVDISFDQLQLLTALPEDRWTDTAALELGSRPVAHDEVEELADAGLVICDTGEGPLAELRDRSEWLALSGWNPYAALCHSFSRWRDLDLGASVDEAPPPDASRPAPPPAFHTLADSEGTHELPLVLREDPLFRLLRERRTTRALDATASLTQDELAVLLYYAVGCHGFRDLGGGLVLLKKTSPSGGSLHPIEVYPLVIAVEGVAAGLYHYRSDRHALDLVHPLEADEARAWLVEFAAGQDYLSAASVLLIMTARFERSFWKYRANPRAYGVVLMDAAHISQTIYLVCAELGLGAFVSAAVNAANIEDRLGVDGMQEGVLAVCGCGRPTARRSPYDIEFEPYVPRETAIQSDG